VDDILWTEPRFYDRATNTTIVIPFLAAYDPVGGNAWEYTVEAMTNDNVVVGNVRLGAHNYASWIWDSANGIRDITTLIDSSTDPGLNFFGSGGVTDINNYGQIVGLHRLNDWDYQPFVLVIPEPATLLVLAGGALGILGRRRR